jgi:hypothetical protein
VLFCCVSSSVSGLQVGRAGLEVDDFKIEAGFRAVPPTNKTGLRRFLGMTGYCRRFTKTYSVVAAPLNKYLKGDREETFNLDAEALQAHKALKKEISTAPVLALPNKTGRYVIEADA